MPCIIKAPQLLFEFQISFFMAPATHYKKIRSLSSSESGRHQRERQKELEKGSGDYLNRGLCVRCDIHQHSRNYGDFIQGEGREREFKSLRSHRVIIVVP